MEKLQTPSNTVQGLKVVDQNQETGPWKQTHSKSGLCGWEILLGPLYARLRIKSVHVFYRGRGERVEPLRKKANRFTNVFIAFTKKCHLQCDHCFEWDVLNKKESLSIDDINKIVKKFQDAGTAEVQLTGGGALLRVNQILDILQVAKKNTDFWILTSGYNLTLEMLDD